jgi:hypothetical protein
MMTPFPTLSPTQDMDDPERLRHNIQAWAEITTSLRRKIYSGSKHCTPRPHDVADIQTISRLFAVWQKYLKINDAFPMGLIPDMMPIGRA